MEEQQYLSFLGAALFAWLLYVFLVGKRSAAEKLRLPPSPAALPVIGHLHLLGANVHRSLTKISDRLGPLVWLRLGPVRWVVASDAETVREFLKSQEIFFTDRPATAVVDTLYSGGTGCLIFAPYGDRWRFARKLCLTELLGSRTLDRLRGIRGREIGRFFRILQDKAEKQEEINVGTELMGLTSNITCQMVMSRRCSDVVDGEASAVQEMMDEVSELHGRFNLADFVGFCRKLDPQGLQRRTEALRRRFDRMMEGIIRHKEETRTAAAGAGDDCAPDATKDLVDTLLEKMRDEAAEVKLTRQDVKFLILDIFAAGTDTSAVTMEWALAELINHPAVLAKAREEIDAAVGGESRMVNESDVPNLPYLQAVVKETLRLHPVVPLIIRQSTGHCRVMGYDIPEKTRLFVNVWAMGRDPNQWEAPLEFRPERFVEPAGRSAGVDLRGQHYQLLPFGSGRRVCPGISLALQVVQPTLAAMIQCFDWRVEGAAVDMAEAPGLTLIRARPLVCTPVARRGPCVVP